MADVTKKIIKGDEFHITDQKHSINQQLVDIIKFRQNKNSNPDIAGMILLMLYK